MGENQKEFLCTYIRDKFDVPTYRLVMSIMYSGAALVTTVLNLLILISIWRTPSLHKPSYILMGSLALSDLLVGAVGDPLVVITNIAVLRGWSAEVFCQLVNCSRGISFACGTVSLVTLTAISLDRLLAVKLRNRYQSVVTKKRVLCGLLTCWITTSINQGTLYGTIRWSNKNASAVSLSGGILTIIPLMIITVCYSMAFYSLRKITSSSVAPSVQNNAVVAGPSSNIDIAKYRKSLITMFVVFILTMVFYAPFFCMSMIIPLIESKGFSTLTSWTTTNTRFICTLSAEFLYFFNSAINPLVYLWRIQDIRQAVKTTVKAIFKIF